MGACWQHMHHNKTSGGRAKSIKYTGERKQHGNWDLFYLYFITISIRKKGMLPLGWGSFFFWRGAPVSRGLDYDGSSGSGLLTQLNKSRQLLVEWVESFLSLHASRMKREMNWCTVALAAVLRALLRFVVKKKLSRKAKVLITKFQFSPLRRGWWKNKKTLNTKSKMSFHWMNCMFGFPSRTCDLCDPTMDKKQKNGWIPHSLQEYKLHWISDKNHYILELTNQHHLLDWSGKLSSTPSLICVCVCSNSHRHTDTDDCSEKLWFMSFTKESFTNIGMG